MKLFTLCRNTILADQQDGGAHQGRSPGGGGGAGTCFVEQHSFTLAAPIFWLAGPRPLGPGRIWLLPDRTGKGEDRLMVNQLGPPLQGSP